MLDNEYFEKFKALTKNRVGEREYSKMTEKELLDGAMALITLVNEVYSQTPRQV